MEIIFLGTGGGRKNMLIQMRRTAGFRINGPINIHVDPGPGVLDSYKKYNQNILRTDMLIATHNHIDHINDAGLVIEAMTDFATRKKGILIGSKSVIIGDKNNDKGVTNYHMGLLSKVIIAKPEKQIQIMHHNTEAVITPTKVRHDSSDGFGFVIEICKKRIGYTSDTEYFDGLSKPFHNCDIIIANNLKPSQDGVPGHLYSEHTAKLFSEAKPRIGILSHMGFDFLKKGPINEAKKIQEISGIKTIPAIDGMRIDFENIIDTNKL